MKPSLMSPNSCMWNPCSQGSSPVIVPFIRVGVFGACISSIEPFTASECSRMHCATTRCSASVIVLICSHVHSFARVLGHLVSVNSMARIVVFISLSNVIKRDQLHLILVIYDCPVAKVQLVIFYAVSCHILLWSTF